MRKHYVVCFMNENGEFETKAYVNRKSAEKYAIKIIEEKMTTLTIDTYVDGECIETERY